VDKIFVGREVELAFLCDLLEEAHGGMSRTVLLEGAPGVGKTALLDAFLARAGRHRVLRASGAELEADLAYGMLDQLVAETGQPPPEPLASLGTGRAADVEPLGVGGALVEMLGRLQADGQILVVLDDAHWGDVPSLQALAFALRRLRSTPVLALLLVRDDRTDHLLASLQGLLTGPKAARLRLGGLGVEELRELSTAFGTGSLSPRAAQRLHEHTGGNPLHARALLEEIPAGILHHSAGPLPAPRSFALLVLARLASCPSDAENLVVAASVLGTSCPLRLASRLGEVANPLKALEQAATAHLLCDHPTAIERQVTFPHPLVRAAVYHDLGPSRRAGLHASAARLVENEPAALRHKVAATCGPDPHLAAEVAAVASRQAAAGCWAAAADNLLAAATLAATPAERERAALMAMDYLRLDGNEAEASTLADELAALMEGVPQGYGQARLARAASRNASAGQMPAGSPLQDEPGSQPRPIASGRTSRNRMVGPRTSLTRQELVVARLVADGRTNRETAEALVVSVKTIEYHLGNTYAKLGVTSRTQLALALRQDPGYP
jgi:DNA-binding CsgD family transcriptional regulator